VGSPQLSRPPSVVPTALDLDQPWLAVDGFFDGARAMRRWFERVTSERIDPMDPLRFQWERWHVPGEFSQQRARARAFFPKELAEAFEARLLSWAGATLGLSALGGPPWLSELLDGQFQALHRDTPNGPIAFSYGLVRPGPLRFRGGETLLARAELLDYWRLGGHAAEAAAEPLFHEVPPRFDRLVCFDSRVPHAVRAVEGPRKPGDGRMAVQGWLRAAGCVAGDAEASELATRTVNRALSRGPRRALSGASGLLSVRVDAAQRRARPRILVDLLAPTDRTPDGPARARASVLEALARIAWPRGLGRVAIPVVVEGGAARVPTR
jgi:hypothetical protein